MKKTLKPLKAKKRLISGFNEVLKSLGFKEKKNLPLLVIIAVNIEKNECKGGTDEKIEKILKFCKEKKICYIFSCSRKELGFALYGRRLKNQPKISCLSVLNCQGFEKKFLGVLECVKENKRIYKERFDRIKYFGLKDKFGN